MAFTTFIDADTHITEPADLWTSRVSSKWADQVLHVKQDNEGTNAWFVGDKKVANAPSGVFAGWTGKFPNSPAHLRGRPSRLVRRPTSGSR